MFEKVFKLKEKHTNVKTEVIAGLTTFLAMAYILGVNPLVLKDAGMDVSSVFLATAISAGFASILMGLLANYPVSLAAGMGVNALFAYTICGQMGMSWQAALAAVFVGMVITAIVGIICGACGIEGMPALPSSILETNLKLDGFGAFASGFGELFADPFQAFIALFSFLFVDFFDTAGTLVAVGNRVGLINEDGELEHAEQALLADAVGTVAGAVLGTSTVTSFVESISGVEVGGRTGLTSCTTGVLFFISILFAPIILSAVTNAVTAPALVVVGIMMAQQLKGIDWDDMVFATAGFVTVIAMILTYSISNGIAFGFIAYAVAMLANGKAKEVHPTVWGLICIFVLYFALPYFM